MSQPKPEDQPPPIDRSRSFPISPFNATCETLLCGHLSYLKFSVHPPHYPLSIPYDIPRPTFGISTYWGPQSGHIP